MLLEESVLLFTRRFHSWIVLPVTLPEAEMRAAKPVGKLVLAARAT